MLKLVGLLSLFAVIPGIVIAQAPPINYGLADSAGRSIAYHDLHAKYDTVVAYTAEGYWQSNIIRYGVLAVKNGEYFKGIFEKKAKRRP